jgi:peptide/nickel transport system permease protein
VRWSYLGRKVLQLLLTLLAVVSFNFLLFRVLPGDPVQLYARSGHLTPQAAAQLRRVFGLDKPVFEQFGIYLRDLAHGQLGFSLTYRRPVADIVVQRLANTVLLVGAATVLVVVLGIGLGVLSASRRGSRVDSATVFGSLILWSMPTFWVGLLLVFAFGVDIGQFVLITRSSLIDVLTEDYITTAKAKGMPRRRIVWRHGMRNALLPVVTASVLYIGLVVGGAIQVETVFSWPGLGSAIFEAVGRRDYPMLQGAFLLLTISVVFFNLVADLLYFKLDPRITA